MNFNQFDFEGMRAWLKNLPCSDARVRRARLISFDIKRYREDYEAIYQYITLMGGEIEGV